jgi:hypothetical protein
MGHADAGPRPGVESGEAEQRSYLLMHLCLAVAALAAFFVVIVPLLIWAAAIVFAGSR